MKIEVNSQVGLWTVLAFAGEEWEIYKSRRYLIKSWLCRCRCGLTKPIKQGNLYNSRGCQRCRNGKRTHGDSKSRLYEIWCGMIKRCENPNQVQYGDYGGRGISLCQEWRDSYESFKKWALANAYGDSLTIERIDVNGDYTASNCAWISNRGQNRNKRNNYPKVEYEGAELHLADVADLLGIKYEILRNRVFRLGWSLEKAIVSPVKQYKERSKCRKAYT